MRFLIYRILIAFNFSTQQLPQQEKEQQMQAAEMCCRMPLSCWLRATKETMCQTIQMFSEEQLQTSKSVW